MYLTLWCLNYEYFGNEMQSKKDQIQNVFLKKVKNELGK
ncbi:Uncharacterised protein [Flavobacterium hibernum]|nr:Uncharacterised protein [Flavobacterium hibernum]